MIRRLAIETLGEIVDPRSADYLLAKLDDPDVASQQAAVNAISAMVAAFPEIKPQVLTKIRRLLQNPSVPMKLNSLSVFVNIQGEGYHDELLLASKDSDPVIRQKAVSLMGMFSEERFADALVLSLADEATAVRLAAINAIVRHRPAQGLRAADLVARRLRHLDSHRRRAGARRIPPSRRDRAARASPRSRSSAGPHRRDRSARQVGRRAGEERALRLRARIRSRSPPRRDPLARRACRARKSSTI